jgi:HAMP domain-containing protein
MSRILIVLLLAAILLVLLQTNTDNRQREMARVDREDAQQKIDAKVRDYYRSMQR